MTTLRNAHFCSRQRETVYDRKKWGTVDRYRKVLRSPTWRVSLARTSGVTEISPADYDQLRLVRRCWWVAPSQAFKKLKVITTYQTIIQTDDIAFMWCIVICLLIELDDEIHVLLTKKRGASFVLTWKKMSYLSSIVPFFASFVTSVNSFRYHNVRHNLQVDAVGLWQ